MAADYPPRVHGPSFVACTFCQITRRNVTVKMPRHMSWPEPGVMAFEPLNPVTPGHMLVVPAAHVPDALTNPATTGLVMQVAARIAQGPCNLITSCGAEATQTVFHLHVHVVPRFEGDGLALPWTAQQQAEEATDDH